jgi:hypothetical protein
MPGPLTTQDFLLDPAMAAGGRPVDQLGHARGDIRPACC